MEQENIGEKKNLCKDIDLLNEKWTTPIRIIYRRSRLNKDNSLKISFGFKFNPHNNLSNIEFNKCRLAELNPLNQILNFSEIYISIK